MESVRLLVSRELNLGVSKVQSSHVLDGTCKSCRMDKCVLVDMNPDLIQFTEPINIEKFRKSIENRRKQLENQALPLSKVKQLNTA